MKTFLGFPLFLLALAVSGQTTYTLDIRVYLEGPFVYSQMDTGLNSSGLIPLSQPYNISPWNYGGTESVVEIPDAGIVDWILIELRETSGNASTATPDKTIHRQAAFINDEGYIKGLDGVSPITYTGEITDNLFILVRHRNHLPVMSAEAVIAIGDVFSYDFTDMLSRAYLDGQKEIGEAIYGMIAGDTDANDTIQVADRYPLWDENAGTQDYTSPDLNLDAQINNQDKDDIWQENLGLFAKLPTQLPFTCGAILLDSRDGQTYNTVQIGTQCWMAESLNIGLMTFNESPMANDGIIEKYCQDNDEMLCQEWGGLYQWDEAMQYTTTESTQGICPASWHIPSETEWDVLDDYLGGYNSSGGPMKEAGILHWVSPNTGATNLSGFTGIASGYSDYQSSTPGHSLWTHNYIWSSTEYGTDYARRRLLLYFNAKSNPYYDLKWLGFSVRCVKD